MYHPYFRGKQYELITIRENAELLCEAKFVPIIEPVKGVLNGLESKLNTVGKVGGSAIVVVNPHHGEHADNGESIINLLHSEPIKDFDISPAILLKEKCSIQETLRLCEKLEGCQVVLIHARSESGADLAEELDNRVKVLQHLFIESYCGRLYRRHFRDQNRVLLRDGFERKRNRDYSPQDFFSDLHITFEEEDVNGFGDFLTVGDEYSETGGPAYAVAIHISFLDPIQDKSMFVHHFLSDQQDTPSDPAGKFGEALENMIQCLDTGQSHILESKAIKEFRKLHSERHYPGLGYVKKLSMQHHIETLADYFEKK
ncbi:MAG: sce7725 family protein [Gammaproteobacteria bacterium]|nr:sce7725 family protein [Gammaproteobacteria bacterium]